MTTRVDVKVTMRNVSKGRLVENEDALAGLCGE